MAIEKLAISEALARTRDLGAPTETALRHLETLMAPTLISPQTGMVYGEQSKYVSYDFDEQPFDTLELIQFTDAQFGHVGCRYDRIVEYRDWVLAAPNRFMLWTGDNIDAHAAWSPGVAWENLCGADRQVYRFCELWAPARHRILGSVGGNHERRALPAFGDLGALIAALLQIPYSGGMQFVDIRFGQHRPFRVSLWHGRGAARTKGAIAQTLERFMQQGDSQLYLMGHLHQALILPVWRMFREGRQMKLQKAIGAVGTSFLETWATYAEVGGFAPGDVMMARAILYRDGKWECTLR